MAEQIDFSDSGLKFPDETGDVGVCSGTRSCTNCLPGCDSRCMVGCTASCMDGCVSEDICI